VRRTPDYDRRPLATESSLERKTDLLLHLLDHEDWIAELEAAEAADLQDARS
jgi:hypothetical protein